MRIILKGFDLRFLRTATSPMQAFGGRTPPPACASSCLEMNDENETNITTEIFSEATVERYKMPITAPACHPTPSLAVIEPHLKSSSSAQHKSSLSSRRPI